ncbi:hypothetical protein CSPB12327_01760 [Campylobacter sp. RM12327]|uniref:hypothetical protein n=1 Tax=Campylobacter sputorum TaxID=206 RepID=UPI00053BEF78|nr:MULTISPECIES: hypothetical protein [Campylobacter]MBE7358067.1 hypothetical protein [Campylobacter sp. RM11302]MBF6668879.1 hypothetical protein [Campylobacter sp. RM12327]MBF6673793.1 hypothetical protein [Campylobacter sp. RM13538]MBF6676303.1 hypothetical protein [Campylobacter sp. RM12321]MBF6677710.1 hypothetical protein [Campylobacter sp. RM11259]
MFDGKKVFFTDFTHLEKIFPNLGKYYRKAEEKDLENLKSSDGINFSDELKLEKINKTNLKKLAQICDNLEKFKNNFNMYREYIINYFPDNKNFENNNFNIKSNDDIKLLHNIIFEKYYTAQIYAEQRIVNSFRKI